MARKCPIGRSDNDEREYAIESQVGDFRRDMD